MGHDPEVVVSLSGGFPFLLPMPGSIYQDSAVSTFLQHLGSKYAALYKCVRCLGPT